MQSTSLGLGLGLIVSLTQCLLDIVTIAGEAIPFVLFFYLGNITGNAMHSFRYSTVD
jgi:hypothetical protein